MSEDGPIEFTDIHMARASLILNLRQHGIVQSDLLRAFEAVPHEKFVPQEYAEYAYRERSLPLEAGQSITSPTILAAMLVELEAANVGKVLEIGTGSGYSSALLSRLAKRVFTIERIGALAQAARLTWDELAINNVVGFSQDGTEGLALQQPFDRILLNGSVEEIPETLFDQLADGGILVAPLGAPDQRQTIVRVERIDDEFISTDHGLIRLAPLVVGKSRAL